MSEELLEKHVSDWSTYNPGSHKDIKKIIQDNINSVCANYVAIGYYLNVVNDRKLYEEDGYSGIGEYASAEYGIQKDRCSWLMKIADRFCIENSPALKVEYRDFSISKLREMIYLDDEQLGQVTISTTVAEIREIRKPEKVATSQLEPEPDKPITVDDLDFSVRTYNCLKRANIDTVEQLCELTEDEVTMIRNISRKCLDEIKLKLSEIGRELKSDISEPVNDKPIGEERCSGECFYCADDDCNSYQEPRAYCLFDMNTKCSIYGSHRIAIASLGIDCKSNCCMSCKEDCGARCNHSAHRPKLTEPDEIFNNEQEPVETVEAEIIQTRPEEFFTDQCESGGQKFNTWLKANNTSIADIVNDVLKDKKLPNEDNIYSKIKNGLISKLILKTEAYYSYLTKELDIKPEQLKPVQPELPTLKNNDQRKEFIDDYETWPIWIDLKETGERYYRYDLTDRVALVVKVSWKHAYAGYRETKDYEYGAEQYYLLGVKSEWSATRVQYVEDDTRTFYECSTNKSALVEYLKAFQKKGA